MLLDASVTVLVASAVAVLVASAAFFAASAAAVLAACTPFFRSSAEGRAGLGVLSTLGCSGFLSSQPARNAALRTNKIDKDSFRAVMEAPCKRNPEGEYHGVGRVLGECSCG